jgi:hypothetical protein
MKYLSVWASCIANETSEPSRAVEEVWRRHTAAPFADDHSRD